MHPTHRRVIFLCIAASILLCTGFAGIGGAQEGVTNETNETDAQTVLKELGTTEIRSAEWDGDTVYLTVAATDGHARLSITDSGAVEDAGSNEVKSVPFETYTVPGGSERRIEFRTSGNSPKITVQEGGEMALITGDVGVIDVITSAPTVQLIYWAGLSGSGGTLLATGTVIGAMKRRHRNTYKELTSGERKRIERDPVDGIPQRIARFLKDHSALIALAVILALWALLWALGQVRGPIALWNDGTDGQRVMTVGILSAALISLLPAYVLIKRVWNPRMGFVLDLDALDVIKHERHADPDEVAIYSGPPSRITEMQTEGGKAQAPAPGGMLTVVRRFDPRENSAETTWPGLASDDELLRDQTKIENNRGRLQGLARAGEEIIKMVPSLTIDAEMGAAASVDQNLRKSLTHDDGDAMNDVLADALDGTAFEGMYDDSVRDMSDRGEDQEDDSGEEVTNTDDEPAESGDSEPDEATNGHKEQ